MQLLGYSQGVCQSVALRLLSMFSVCLSECCYAVVRVFSGCLSVCCYEVVRVFSGCLSVLLCSC